MNVIFSKVCQFPFDYWSTSWIDSGEEKRYTFKAFQEQVNSFAASLLELGLEKGDRFAVWLPNTSENVIMSFVASKLGLIKVEILSILARQISWSFHIGQH